MALRNGFFSVPSEHQVGNAGCRCIACFRSRRRLGFTGTRNGMTDAQLNKTSHVMQYHGCSLRLPPEFHHGDCVGADQQANAIAVFFGFYIIIHPPRNKTLRAMCVGASVILPEQDYLVRNRDIVSECDILIAAPADDIQTGGTWRTVRYAMNVKRHIVIVKNDGSVQEFNK